MGPESRERVRIVHIPHIPAHYGRFNACFTVGWEQDYSLGCLRVNNTVEQELTTFINNGDYHGDYPRV